jgi:integrase
VPELRLLLDLHTLAHEEGDAMTTEAKATANTMRGGVRKRGKDGAWTYTIDLGPQPAQRCNKCGAREWLSRKALEKCPKCGGEMHSTKERRQQTGGGYATRTAATKARTTALHELGQGVHVMRDKITLGDWLRDEWLPSLAIGKLRATTLASYRSHVEQHLAPTKLGAETLQDVTRERIAAHYAWLLKEGRADGSTDDKGKLRPLSPATVRRIHATLHRALRDAVRSRLLPLNPADDIDLESAPRAGGALRIWSAEQLGAFLESTRGDRLTALWRLLSFCGARRGEVLALRWDDVDLQLGTVSISKSRTPLAAEIVEMTTKTDRARVVALDPDTVDALREHAARQLDELEGNSDALAARYVFTDEEGEPLNPRHVSRWFHRATHHAALPSIRLYDLRHTHASLLLQAGVPAKIVQERLGHSSITVTMDVYSHVIPQMDAEAAVKFADLVASAARAR